MLINSNQQILQAITKDYKKMVLLLEKWVNINSHSENLEGLSEMLISLKQEFSLLEGKMEKVPLSPYVTINKKGELIEKPLGHALHIHKHPQANLQIFLGGHMDTVFSKSSPFQKAVIDQDRMNGPGSADMKGGLVILLRTLQALENSPLAGQIGWEVFINPDEELGSPGSNALFEKFAAKNQIGLLFEPSFPDGSFVGARKGSANFTLISKGKSAHAGRDFFEGRNAIEVLAQFICEICQLSNKEKGLTINVGVVEGGEASNIVPDTALCRFNVRAWNAEDFKPVKMQMNAILEKWNQKEGYQLNLFENTMAPPKPLDKKMENLINLLSACGECIDLKVKFNPSGGVCDGSRLYAYGLPNIDTLGIVGGGLHSVEEYAFLPSLVQRSQLALLYLFMLYDNYTK